MPCLGDRVRDKATGFEGIATAITERLFADVMIQVEREELNSIGEPIICIFPEDRLTTIAVGAVSDCDRDVEQAEREVTNVINLYENE